MPPGLPRAEERVSDETETPSCSARLCAVCHEPAHTPGEECDAGEACTTTRIHLGMTCRRCYERMARQLADLPKLYVYAGQELTPGAGSDTGGRGTERGIGVRIAALDLRAGLDLLGVLGQWERDWRETFEDPAPTAAPRAHRDRVGADLVAVCGWLRANLIRSARAHPAIDVFAGELGELHQAASIAARTVGRREVWVECPTDVGQDANPDLTGQTEVDPDAGPRRCGKRLRLTGLDATKNVWCRGCRRSWNVQRLLMVAASDVETGVWLPPEDVAILLGVSERTLRLWAKDGEVDRAHGRYELGSVKDAIRRGVARTRPAGASGA